MRKLTGLLGFHESFGQVEKIKKFKLLPREWTVAEGELTPTLKMKRKVIMKNFEEDVKSIYGTNS